MMIPHRLYFAECAPKWDYQGVAFLDPRKNLSEHTLGRMYLITESQYDEIHKQEGLGWYNMELDLGACQDYPIKTFTNVCLLEPNPPGQRYLKAVADGIREAYPEMTDTNIDRYIDTTTGLVTIR